MKEIKEGFVIETLEKHFGFSTFRTGQKEIIKDILSGHDVLGILPTGTGKSLCYQLPSILFRGITIVVSPLISLMIDQVKQLKAKGFKRVAAINSMMNVEQKKAIINNLNQYKLIYVSPEMLQNSWIMKVLLTQHISLFVIDEAHCISQWGHEFRTDYLKLKAVISQLNNPPVLALSATATPEVQQDIMHYLGRPKMLKRIYPMDRENIAFVIEHTANWTDKVDRIINLLKEKQVPTMIYFSSRMWCEKISTILGERLPNRNVSYYHGGMDSEDRLLIQQQFMNNQLDIICCTSAFGMGVDKPDVRLVIHFHMPTQLESYIQEVGRAGRDGKQSVGLVLYSNGDEQIPLTLIEQELPTDKQIQDVFHFLSSTTIRELPQLEEAIFINLELNETQWGFISHQLERNNLIENGILVNDHSKWRTGLETTLAYRNKRMRNKEELFTQFLSWIHSTSCRREKLYESFQNGFTKPELLCCDHCHSVLSNWQTEGLPIKDATYNWNEKLKKIFQIG